MIPIGSVASAAGIVDHLWHEGSTPRGMRFAMPAGAAVNIFLTSATVIGFGLAIWQSLRAEHP